MAQTLSIAFTASTSAPPGGYIVKYRIKGSSDPYTTLYPNQFSSPISITGLPDGYQWEGTIAADCIFGTSALATFDTNDCNCAPGYTPAPDNSYCYKVTQVPADQTGGSTTLACHYTASNNYGIFGSVFYKMDGSGNPLYGTDGTWNPSDPTAKPTLLAIDPSGYGVNASAFNISTIPSTSPWTNADMSSAVNSRLNLSGVWDCADQEAESTLGFVRTINLTDSKVYYIGCGSDDYGSIYVNGTLILSQSVAATKVSTLFNNSAGNHLFRYWHVYPVQLNSGPNNIELRTTNTGSLGILGFEIYNATEAQLVACTSVSDLNPYIVFSTKDIANNSPFSIGNYNCDSHPGYTLVYDSASSSFVCQKIDTLACGAPGP